MANSSFLLDMLSWLPSQNITTSCSGSRHFPSRVNQISWFEIAVSPLSPISILFSSSEVPDVVPFFTAQLCVNWNRPISLCTYISFPLHMFLYWFNLLSLYFMSSTFSYVVGFQHHSYYLGNLLYDFEQEAIKRNPLFTALPWRGLA